MKAVVIALLAVSVLSHAAEKEKISIEEFRENKVLIGKLGKPFGKVVRVTCRGIVPTEEEKNSKWQRWKSQVDIIAIEGERVEPPIRLEWKTYTGQTPKKPEAGVSFEVLAYESGGFEGTPSKVPRPRQDVGFAFECCLVALERVDLQGKPK